MKEMRRPDRKISDNEAVSILGKEEFGILSTIGEGGNPYGIPLNFCHSGDSIYFHCALEGLKIVNIENNPSVCFTVVGSTQVLPDQFGTLYESVVVSGRALEVFTEEKQKGLELLIYKYSPDFIESGLKYISSLFKKTRVFKLEIESLSGKARKR